MKIFEVILRGILGFFVLLILVRIIGKKQLGELSFFNYITGIALGNIAGDMIVHKDISITDALMGLIIWTIFAVLLEYISLKSPKARRILNGESVLIIKKGVVLKDILASHRMNMDELNMLLRNNNVFSIKDVDYAVLEPNGQLSVLRKSENEVVTKKDMKVQNTTRKYIPLEIIIDGKVIRENLQELNLDNKWLGHQLAKNHINSVKEVFYAEVQEDGSLYILKME